MQAASDDSADGQALGDVVGTQVRTESRVNLTKGWASIQLVLENQTSLAGVWPKSQLNPAEDD